MQLSEVLPILENLGLQVDEEVPTRLNGGDGETFLHNFGVLDENGRLLDLATCGERVADCIAAVWHGQAESDALNRLVISAGLTWHQVAVLRAYRKYRQRVGAQLPIEYQNATFARHPDVSALAGALLRGAVRSGPADRGRRGGRAAPADPRGARRHHLARRRPHPAQPPRHGRRDGAHERVPEPAAPVVQVRVGGRAADAEAVSAVRDLRLLAGHGGHPPARRPRRPRRHPLVGPPRGLPHRDPRA